MEELVTCEGTVHSVIFQNAENGYTVLRLLTEEGEVITVVGCIPCVAPGEHLTVSGVWEQHPQHGQQLRAVGVDVDVDIPAQVDWASQDAYLIGWGSPFDADDHTYKVFGTGKGGNYSGYSDPLVDEYLTAARQTDDPEERARYYGLFQEDWRADSFKEAAQVILGSNNCGLDVWVAEDGRTIGEVLGVE